MPFGVAAEVVIHDQLRLPLPAGPGVLEISNHFLFFRIDADVNAGQPSVPGSVLSYA